MVYILAEVNRWDTRKDLGAWIQHAVSWLATRSLSRQIGVMAPLSSRTGVYGTVATGFAGVGIAELIDPASLAPTGPGPAPLNTLARVARKR
jgi:hypothetical protein